MKLTGVMNVTTEQLDKIYFCRTCKAAFLFASDIEEHIQSLPMHEDFVTAPFN